jgi:hypothetical protein
MCKTPCRVQCAGTPSTAHDLRVVVLGPAVEDRHHRPTWHQHRSFPCETLGCEYRTAACCSVPVLRANSLKASATVNWSLEQSVTNLRTPTDTQQPWDGACSLCGVLLDAVCGQRFLRHRRAVCPFAVCSTPAKCQRRSAYDEGREARSTGNPQHNQVFGSIALLARPPNQLRK